MHGWRTLYRQFLRGVGLDCGCACAFRMTVVMATVLMETVLMVTVLMVTVVMATVVICVAVTAVVVVAQVIVAATNGVQTIAVALVEDDARIPG